MFEVGDKVWDEKSDMPGVVDHVYGGGWGMYHVRHRGATQIEVRGECWLQHIADYLREEEALLGQKRKQLDAIRQWAKETHDANA